MKQVIKTVAAVVMVAAFIGNAAAQTAYFSGPAGSWSASTYGNTTYFSNGGSASTYGNTTYVYGSGGGYLGSISRY
jgi:hypothetical protein